MAWQGIQDRFKRKAALSAAARRAEFLTPFGLLIVAVIVGALGGASVLALQSLERHVRYQAADAAPTHMRIFSGSLHGRLNGEPHELQSALNDIGRSPHVRFCRLARTRIPGEMSNGPATSAAEQKELFVAGRMDELDSVLCTLQSSLRSEDGSALGRLEVGFESPQLHGLRGVLWTAAGLVAAGALGIFFLSYRWMGRRLRPLTYVRENLLAYRDGTEQSLELLALQDRSDGLAQAWNKVIDFVHELQTEVDTVRCRQAVVESISAERSQSLRTILDNLTIGVLRIDAGGMLIYANHAATALLAIRPEGTSGAGIAARIPDPGFVARVSELRSLPTGSGVDHRLAVANGRTVVRLTAIEGEPESEGELVLMVQDISQLKEAERAREEFLAHITHELRTPLTNIRAYTETLNEDFFDDEQTRRDCYNVIMSETRRLTKLIEDVLSASQFDAGVARFERKPVRVEPSLRQAVQEIQAAADAKALELELRIPSKLPAVEGDPQRLHQVWINLIGNAVKYTPRSGSIGVDVSADGQNVHVRVWDTGIGIPAEFHEKIFEKFFRVNDGAVEAEEGTGLGLAITREIVRMHGGTLRVESAPQKGTTFIVELPVYRESGCPGLAEAARGEDRHR